MKTTRWKWMIGGLGLSLGGLAAVAGSPTKNTLLSCQPTTQTVAYRTTETPPVNVPAPKAADVPAGNFPITPAPAMIPTIPSPTEPTPVVVAPTPTLPTPATPQLSVPSLPQPVVPITPRVELPTPAPLVPEVKPLEMLRIEPAVIPVPAISMSRNPAEPVSVPPQGLPKVEPVTPTLDFRPIPTGDLKPTTATPAPATPVSSKPENLLPPVREASSKVSEKKLKVILFMSDERPRFEVRDGDEIYLKVVCNHVEVKSPGENGSNLSTMKASGNVTFTTPGGEGTCADLVVMPGTGSVQVRGNVQFTHNWGKMETTVTGESMTFRLGAVTVQPTPTSSSGTVPTSYTK